LQTIESYKSELKRVEEQFLQEKEELQRINYEGLQGMRSDYDQRL